MINKCIICGSTEVIKLRKFQQFFQKQCKNCDLAFLSPLPSDAVIRSFNTKKYNSIESQFASVQVGEKLYKRAISCLDFLTIQGLKQNLKVLDIGTGYGFYLKAFKDRGYIPLGIEVLKAPARFARKSFKLNILEGDYSKHKFKDTTFDLITLFDVFEHFRNPIKIVNKIKLELKKKGLVIIQTPNINSLIYKITGKKWFWLLIPQHLFLYSIQSLKYLLEKNGFEIFKIQSWDAFEEFAYNILWVLGVKNKGKTQIIHLFLYMIIWLFYPLSLLWCNFGFGGELTIYARKK